MAVLPRMALSVRQPWAWAIVLAGKDIENRVAKAVSLGGMPAMIGQRIAIHASRGMTRDEYDGASYWITQQSGIACPEPWRLPFGAIVGSVLLVDIVKRSDSKWWIGPRGLVLADPQPCAPIPAKGQLGMFEWQPCAADDMPPLPKWLQGPRETVAGAPTVQRDLF